MSDLSELERIREHITKKFGIGITLEIIQEIINVQSRFTTNQRAHDCVWIEFKHDARPSCGASLWPRKHNFTYCPDCGGKVTV